MIHVVRPGECLSSIAAHYGIVPWRKIYDHPRNADFKRRRPNPNLIYAGDELYIPDKESRIIHCPTGQAHRFRVRVPTTWFNMCLQDEAKQPIAEARFCLMLDNHVATIAGETDGKGWIKAEIPAWAEFGQLMLWPHPDDDETVLTWKVRLGHLDPLDTTSGVKGRLQNLGYVCDVNDVQDEEYFAAVREFQRDHGLVVDGIVGPKTRGKLKQEHRV